MCVQGIEQTKMDKSVNQMETEIFCFGLDEAWRVEHDW